MGSIYERRFKCGGKGNGWGAWEGVDDSDVIPAFGFEFGVKVITIVDRDGDKWQYREKVEAEAPVAQPVKEMHYRLITRSMRAEGHTDPDLWGHRNDSGMDVAQLDVIESLLRSTPVWGVSGIDVIDGDGDTWEYRLR